MICNLPWILVLVIFVCYKSSKVMILSLLYNHIVSVTAPFRKTNSMISHYRENFKSNISYGKIYHCGTCNNTWKISIVKISDLKWKIIFVLRLRHISQLLFNVHIIVTNIFRRLDSSTTISLVTVPCVALMIPGHCFIYNSMIGFIIL